MNKEKHVTMREISKQLANCLFSRDNNKKNLEPRAAKKNDIAKRHTY